MNDIDRSVNDGGCTLYIECNVLIPDSMWQQNAKSIETYKFLHPIDPHVPTLRDLAGLLDIFSNSILSFVSLKKKEQERKRYKIAFK
jgi:hypothetical protein